MSMALTSTTQNDTTQNNALIIAEVKQILQKYNTSADQNKYVIDILEDIMKIDNSLKNILSYFLKNEPDLNQNIQNILPSIEQIKKYYGELINSKDYQTAYALSTKINQNKEKFEQIIANNKIIEIIQPITNAKDLCKLRKRPTNHRFAHITHNKITKYHYFGKQHYVII